MLSKISFALVENPRASFTHFIDNAGQCAAIDSLHDVEEVRVGIFCDLSLLDRVSVTELTNDGGPTS